MSTTVTFDIASDDERLRQAVADVKGDAVLTWRLAVFCCQMQLDKALRAEGVREHYAKRKRARQMSEQMIEDKGDFRAGLGVDLADWGAVR